MYILTADVELHCGLLVLVLNQFVGGTADQHLAVVCLSGREV